MFDADCFYCGRTPQLYGGIDRVDSSVGYQPDNCVPCCTMCNLAKSDRSQADFIQWAKELAANLKAKNL